MLLGGSFLLVTKIIRIGSVVSEVVTHTNEFYLSIILLARIKFDYPNGIN